jgi:hypothetical protein
MVPHKGETMDMPLDELFATRTPATCVCPGYAECCVCSPAERALRAYAYGAAPLPMTDTQRNACLMEIGGVEGYDREDYLDATDQELAHGVLSAWTDYCRDLGLL